MLHRDEAGWANPRVIAILAIVFFCGSVVGAALTRQYLHSRMASSQDEVTRMRRLKFDALKHQLDLTTAQEQTVLQVLDDFAKYYQNLEEQREDVAEAGKKRIYAVLNSEQKERFAKILKEAPPPL
jgi:LPS O-antigen subunit length determinant protein (WzzB/FepE family)